MSNSSMLDVLTREGVLINVSVRYWRSVKKLKAEDLGLAPDDMTDKLISLGHKKLLPREALLLEYAARNRAHRFTRVGDNVYDQLEAPCGKSAGRW